MPPHPYSLQSDQEMESFSADDGCVRKRDVYTNPSGTCDMAMGDVIIIIIIVIGRGCNI